MLVMREIQNVKQTQVHPGDPSYGWKWKAFLDDLPDRSSAAVTHSGSTQVRFAGSGRVVGQSENGHLLKRRLAITPVMSPSRHIDG